MKNIIFIALAIFFLIPDLKANHVVGGDITVSYVSQNQYDIQLQFYRDELGMGTPWSSILNVTVGIYEVGTNTLLQSVILQRDSITFVPLGDDCYVVDSTVYKIRKGVFSNTTPINIPDFAAGYYIQYQTFARNSLSVNLSSPTSTSITFFATLSDPALGQNSTPKFDIYPPDAYFCINTQNVFNLNVTDPDGDSLYYSLTTPIAGSGSGTGTFAGAGAYPYYAPVIWNVGGGYNLANIVGGSTAMSINPSTGDITASPTIIAYFTFAVRVEEYRNGVKMGEIRRDIQYAGFNCVGGTPPTFLNSSPVDGDTIEVEYNKQYCKDLIFNDLNVTDTLYIEFVSTIFDSNARTVSPPIDAGGNQHYFYNGSGNPVVWADSVVIPLNQTDTNGTFNQGTVAERFCWTPTCSTIGQTFPFEINAFSLGCDGRSEKSINFYYKVISPPIDFKFQGNMSIPVGIETCKNIVFHDLNLVDAMQIEITSDIFSTNSISSAAYFPDVDNNFGYENNINNGYPYPITTNVANGAPSAISSAKRFCWTPSCEDIGGTFNVQATISSPDCPSAETLKGAIDFTITVTPPFDSLDVISNVFSPNGDGINDFYTLGYTQENGNRVGGTSNPCNDAINVQVFNRWGTLVYESTDYPDFQWDGTNKSGGKVTPGTYFVLISGTYGSEKITLGQRSVTVLDSK